MRRSSTLLAWCVSSLLACANGDNAGSGTPSVDGSAGAPAEGGLVDGPGGGPTGDDGGPTGPTGPTGPGGMPGVYDGGPPAMVGGVVDASAYGSGDGAAGTTDAGTDAGFDAATCGTADGGTYMQTCTNCMFNAPILSCSCTTKSNTQNATTLNVCTCAQPPVIANNDGVLTCP